MSDNSQSYKCKLKKRMSIGCISLHEIIGYFWKYVKFERILLKYVIQHAFFMLGTCYFQICPYICSVFFIVLDLRLTKVGVQRYSFFFAHHSRYWPGIHCCYLLISYFSSTVTSSSFRFFLIFLMDCLYVSCEIPRCILEAYTCYSFESHLLLICFTLVSKMNHTCYSPINIEVK